MPVERTGSRGKAQLLTTRQAGDRKRKLGQEQGKQFRGYGYKRREGTSKNCSEFNLEYLDEIVGLERFAPKQPNGLPTAFENAVETYLHRVAIAQAKKKPLPGVPRLIKRRYSGDTLRTWKKNILRTELFKKVRRAALKSLSHVTQ